MAEKWKCPICGSEHQDSVLECKCGFDRSRDWVHFSVFFQPDEKNVAIQSAWIEELRAREAKKALKVTEELNRRQRELEEAQRKAAAEKKAAAEIAAAEKAVAMKAAAVAVVADQKTAVIVTGKQEAPQKAGRLSFFSVFLYIVGGICVFADHPLVDPGFVASFLDGGWGANYLASGAVFAVGLATLLAASFLAAATAQKGKLYGAGYFAISCLYAISLAAGIYQETGRLFFSMENFDAGTWGTVSWITAVAASFLLSLLLFRKERKKIFTHTLIYLIVAALIMFSLRAAVPLFGS